MKPSIHDLPDLFFDQLRDIHSVESQVAGTLPHLAQLATLPDLRELFEAQHKLTAAQQRGVTGIFERHSKSIGSDECLAMKGLIQGGNEHLEGVADPALRDLLLVAHWTRIKHYEIAAYRFVTDLSRHLGEAADQRTLTEYLAAEVAAEKHLQAVAGTLFARKPASPPSSDAGQAVS